MGRSFPFGLRPEQAGLTWSKALTSMFSIFQRLYKGMRVRELLIGSHVSYADAVTPPKRPENMARKLLFIAAVIVSAESVTFIVLAGLDLAQLSGDRVGFGIGVGLLLAAYGAGQVWAAWRVTQGDAWARSPLVVTQLIQLLLAFNLRGGDADWLAALMAGSALVVLGCLLAPPVTRALSDDDHM